MRIDIDNSFCIPKFDLGFSRRSIPMVCWWSDMERSHLLDPVKIRDRIPCVIEAPSFAVNPEVAGEVKLLDKDKSGQLSILEISRLAKRLKMKPFELMAAMDSSKNGQVSWPEFARYMRNRR